MISMTSRISPLLALTLLSCFGSAASRHDTDPTLTYYTGAAFEASEFQPLMFGDDGTLYVVRLGVSPAYFKLVGDGTAETIKRSDAEAIAPLSAFGTELKAIDKDFRKAHPGALNVSRDGKMILFTKGSDNSAWMEKSDGTQVDLTNYAFQLDLSSRMKKISTGDSKLTSPSAISNDGKWLAGTAEIDGATQMWVLHNPKGM